VVGSNVFNLLDVLGLTGLLAPTGIAVPAAMVGFDIPVMIAVALVCLPICFTGGVIRRWEGGALFVYYLTYTLYLILAATHHDALPVFSVTMLYITLPLTALTLVVLACRSATEAYGRDPLYLRSAPEVAHRPVIAWFYQPMANALTSSADSGLTKRYPRPALYIKAQFDS
jgi:hypothetical protein